jgi:hypothetical protein
MLFFTATAVLTSDLTCTEFWLKWETLQVTISFRISAKHGMWLAPFSRQLGNRDISVLILNPRRGDRHWNFWLSRAIHENSCVLPQNRSKLLTILSFTALITLNAARTERLYLMKRRYVNQMTEDHILAFRNLQAVWSRTDRHAFLDFVSHSDGGGQKTLCYCPQI